MSLENQDVNVQDSNIEQPEAVNEEVEAKKEAINEPTEPKETSQLESEDNSGMPADNLIEIDGVGKVSVDEIKEWKQGNMRLADYTRKTQELARQRKEAKEAIEFYETLKSNPDLYNQIKQVLNGENAPKNDKINNSLDNLDPINRRIEQIEERFAMQELQNEIERLKEKYPDFDEVKVLTEADKRGITDLEFVYRALREDNMVDKESIIKEVRKQLLEELKQNANATETIINNGDTSPKTTQDITPQEKRVAENMGLTVEEYIKWKNR